VFSSRELAPTEGADLHFVSGPVAPVHAALVVAAGERNAWLVGGGGLAVAFADEGLLDELHLTVVPVVLGSGIPAFAGRLRDSLALAGTRVFRNGMVELRYDVVR
jgi:dihydrofolate reductase